MAVTLDKVASATAVEYINGSGGPKALDIVWGVNPTAGATVIVAFWTWSSGTITSVIDNGTSPITLTQVSNALNGSLQCWIYKADSITLPSSGSYKVTVTPGTAGLHSMDAGGVSYLGLATGAASSTPNTTQANGTGGGLAIGAGTDSLLFAIYFNDTGTNSAPTMSGSFTLRAASSNGSTAVVGAIADFIGAGSTTATFTSGTGNWVIAGASFLAPVVTVPTFYVPGVLIPNRYVGPQPLRQAWRTPTIGPYYDIPPPAGPPDPGFVPNVRVASNRVGPPALRQLWHQPYINYQQGAFPTLATITTTTSNQNSFFGGSATHRVLTLCDGNLLITYHDGNTSQSQMLIISNPQTRPQVSLSIPGFSALGLGNTIATPDVFVLNNGTTSSDVWVTDTNSNATAMSVTHAVYTAAGASWVWDTRTTIPSSTSGAVWSQIVWTGTYLIAAWTDKPGGTNYVTTLAYTTTKNGTGGWSSLVSGFESNTPSATKYNRPLLARDSVLAATLLFYTDASASGYPLRVRVLPDNSVPSLANWGPQVDLGVTNIDLDQLKGGVGVGSNQYDDMNAWQAVIDGNNARFHLVQAGGLSGVNAPLTYITGTIVTDVANVINNRATVATPVTVDTAGAAQGADTMVAIGIDTSNQVWVFWGWEPGATSGDIYYATLVSPYTALATPKTNLTNNLAGNFQATHIPANAVLSGRIPVFYASGIAINPGWTIWMDTSLSTPRVSSNIQRIVAALSFVGAFFKQTGKNNTAGLSFTGAQSRIPGRILSAGLSFSGAINRASTRSLAGGLSFIGGFTKTPRRSLTAGLSFVGAMPKLTNRALTGGLSFTGTFVKQAQRAIAAGLSFVGTFQGSKVAIRAFTAGLSFAGTFSKQANKALPAGLSFVGSRNVQITRSLGAGLSFVGGMSKATTRALGGGLSFVGNTTRRMTRVLTGGLSFIGGIATNWIHGGTAYVKALAGGLSFSGAITRQYGKKLTGGLSFTGVFASLKIPFIAAAHFLTITASMTASGAITTLRTYFGAFKFASEGNFRAVFRAVQKFITQNRNLQ